MSLITYGLIIFNVVIRITEFFDRSTQVEQVQETKVDLLIDEPHLLADSDFDIVMGATSPIPEEIGRWRAKRSYKTVDDTLFAKVEELKTSDCLHIAPKLAEFWYKRAGKEISDFIIGSTQTSTCLDPDVEAVLQGWGGNPTF